ncbi:hypothetical protein [Streptomyces sp. NPDC090022]|uniref:hypothetical protein n=1 Tax=Streptomyces sp. NPDC090022 TaxID=3365920 RepID=UPI00382F4A02
MSAADELHAAAERLRTLATAATAGPWYQHDTHLNQGGHTATVLTDRENVNDNELIAWVPTWSHQAWDETRNAWNNAAYLAAMHPGVGTSLAELLAATADFAAAYPEMAHDHDRPACDDYACDVMGRALAVARTILGTQDDGSSR